jgi:hypothetical protein
MIASMISEMKSSTAYERPLLEALKQLVSCNCLEKEDPSSPNFVDWDPKDGFTDQELIFEPVARAYNLDCEACGKESKGEVNFKCCGHCKMVRYCSTECQKADWSKHKVVCNIRRPSWWGRAQRAVPKTQN